VFGTTPTAGIRRLRGTKRIILIVVGVLLALIAISFVLFVLGGEEPGDGRGDPIGLSATP
jgi:hypothetical protein